VAAGFCREQFRFGPGVLSAVERTDGVDFADGKALVVVGEERTAIGQFTAGAAAITLTGAFFVNRQKRGKRASELGGPGVFWRVLCFFDNCRHRAAG